MLRSVYDHVRAAAFAALLVLLATAPVDAQGLKIAAGDVGLAIGPVPEITGLRLNFRDDDRFRRATGINLTIWSPKGTTDAEVSGLALGMPLTGAGQLTGIGLGAGIGVNDTFDGIGIGAIGIGAGGDLTGLMIGGVGVGGGSSINGIAIGGLGAGVGNDMTGIAVGGLAVGAGNRIEGIALGGIGVGSGGSIEGVVVAGGGVGAGGDLTGLSVAGLGIGAGGHLRYVAIAGVGVGAPEITGVAAALGVGGTFVQGLMLAPAYFRIEEGGELRGVSVSAYNTIRGSQNGLSIGIINIAEELHGLQIGLINIARNKDRFPVLPLFNYHP